MIRGSADCARSRSAGQLPAPLAEVAKETPVCLPGSAGESIRIWALWQTTAGENVRLEKTGVRGLIVRKDWAAVSPAARRGLMASRG